MRQVKHTELEILKLQDPHIEFEFIEVKIEAKKIID